MKNNRGVTLIELLIVVVVGGIMILAVGTTTDIGKQSHQTLQDEMGIYNDISYAFKLIQNRVHEGVFVTLTVETMASPWIGQRLVLGDEAFGIYDQTGNTMDFVYLPDKDDVNSRQTIISVLDTDMIYSSFSVTGNKVEITITGTKGDISFNVSTTVVQRG